MSDPREAQPAEAGWVRKFVAEADKAREYARVYEELGFEVRLEPLEGALAGEEECQVCLRRGDRSYLVIYARRK
ncbi:MAG: hypothetical protein ACPLPT_06035 [Moorellales bacterium]